jgi:hypothetical protein
MNDRRYDAMQHAVALALSGRCSNWWAVMARLRIKRYHEADVTWTESQRMWLDQLCNEARLAVAGWSQGPAQPMSRLLPWRQSPYAAAETGAVAERAHHLPPA